MDGSDGLRIAINDFCCFHPNNDASKCEVVHSSPPIRSPTIRATDLVSLAGGVRCAAKLSMSIKS
jgi:hypothetical protein